MPGIFRNILLQPKEGRTTRSRARYLQQIKRVVTNVGQDSDTFEHFCNVSINDRISNLTNNNGTFDPVTLQISDAFSSTHNICERRSKLFVIVKHKGARRSKSLKGRQKKRSVNSDVDTCDSSLVQNENSQMEADEDDVIVINPPEESVIIIDDSIIVPDPDPPSAPFNSKLNTCHTQLAEDVTAIKILDDAEEDKDIVFVGEKILNTNQSDEEKRRLKKRKARTLKKWRKKNKKKFTEATLQSVCIGTNLELLDKRCAKCINVNAKLANSCTCKNNNAKGKTTIKLNPVTIARNFRTPCNLVNRQQHPALSVPPSNPCNVNSANRTGLREIVIDGSNVAFGHTNGRLFSVKGLQIAIDYFTKRGHKVVAFVPQFRQKHNQTTDRGLLNRLANKGHVVFTPSREVAGKRITPYDDRYIIEYATACGGVVVSSDNYRDLFIERPDWRATIANRLLMPTWVGDMLMFPEDPLGRDGPNLSRFLSFP